MEGPKVQLNHSTLCIQQWGNGFFTPFSGPYMYGKKLELSRSYEQQVRQQQRRGHQQPLVWKKDNILSGKYSREKINQKVLMECDDDMCMERRVDLETIEEEDSGTEISPQWKPISRAPKHPQITKGYMSRKSRDQHNISRSSSNHLSGGFYFSPWDPRTQIKSCQ